MEEEEKERVNKNFKTWLILNYKTGRFRVMKKIGKLNPSEIAIDFSLDILLPRDTIIVAKGTVELSSAKIASMTLEELEE